MYQIPDTIYPIVNAEVHAADVFRVLGPFSNSEKFNMDWNCPKGSKMNRATKCTMWGKDL